ncbi:uroporphyrinogen decarboxylase family protein [Desulfococcaceae bacterium HSG7]|nr:uroporphyrinogen decarboxylase family protein [Desulfococcaceae bacterium HSG7]
MNASERMAAAIALKPVDRIPNAPFYEAPICRYFGRTFRSALLEAQNMVDCHIKAVETFRFDWVMVGMGLIGGIIPDAMGCTVSWPEDVFPIIEKTTVFSLADVKRVAQSDVHTERMERFLKGISILKDRLNGEIPIACEYISPFTIATRLRGTNEIMADMYDNPELVRDLQDVLVPLNIEIGRALIEAGVEYIFYGADMECPLLISPDHYREFVHEPTSKVVNALSELGARVLPHLCGSIVKTGIADMLLEMDMHGIMPGNLTQETVLDIRELKEKVGDRTAIFDNLNPNGPLLIGTPEEVEKETVAHLEKARGMSGYLFSTAGTTSPSTPRANFDAMNQTVLNFK